MSAPPTASRVLSAAIGPAAITTGLLYYFGWSRSRAIADELGYDVSLLELSHQDYVLRAVQPIASTILVFGLFALVAVRTHKRLAGLLMSRIKRVTPPKALTKVLRGLGYMLLVAGVLLAIKRSPSFSLSAILLAAALCIGYGVWLRQFEGDARFRTGALAPEFRWTVVSLIVAAGFIAVTTQAATEGRAQARLNIERAGTSPIVTVTSNSPLLLNDVPVQRLGDHYVYTGLVLLFSENDRHFLLPVGFDRAASASLYTIPAAGTRLDFDLGRTIPCASSTDLSPGASFAVGESFRLAGVSYDVVALNEPGEGGFGQVTIEEGNDDMVELHILNALIAPRLRESFLTWRVEYEQRQIGVEIVWDGVSQSANSISQLAQADGDADMGGELDAVGSSEGTLWIRNYGQPLESVAFGGRDLSLRC